MSKIQQLQCDQWRVEPLGVTSFGQNPGPVDFCSVACLVAYFATKDGTADSDHPTRRLGKYSRRHQRRSQMRRHR